MKNSDKNNFFWISYADLMTSMFFIMLVLFVLATFAFKLNQQQLEDLNAQLKADVEQLKEIKNIEEALTHLDDNYFDFDKQNKRFRVKANVQFKPDSDNINDINEKDKKILISAGNNLYKMIKELILKNPDVEYLLVIEGNTQRINNNWINIPNQGYELSYRRALALINMWYNNDIDFYKLHKNCEIIIAGSGYFGQSRDEQEINNRRFTIQITSKVGKFLQQ